MRDAHPAFSLEVGQVIAHSQEDRLMLCWSWHSHESLCKVQRRSAERTGWVAHVPLLEVLRFPSEVFWVDFESVLQRLACELQRSLSFLPHKRVRGLQDLIIIYLEMHSTAVASLEHVLPTLRFVPLVSFCSSNPSILVLCLSVCSLVLGSRLWPMVSPGRVLTRTLLPSSTTVPCTVPSAAVRAQFYLTLPRPKRKLRPLSNSAAPSINPSRHTGVSFSNPASRATLPLPAVVPFQPPQVMGSFDDYVMTPHSSFSELGATLSHTWLPDPDAALRILPNRPIVPLFPRMNEFERQKVLSLLDRRAAEIVPDVAGGAAREGSGGKEAMCMRSHAAGMSVVVAKRRELLSMFEAIEGAPCMKGESAGIAGL